MVPTKNLCRNLESEHFELCVKPTKVKMAGVPPWRTHMICNSFLPNKVSASRRMKEMGTPDPEPVFVEAQKHDSFWMTWYITSSSINRY